MKRLLYVLPLVGVVLILAWLRLAPVEVNGFPANRGEVVAEVMGRGTLEARTQTTISPKMSGRLKDVLVDLGSAVKEGQTLALLDDSDLIQQVAIAQASLVASEASVRRVEADIEQTRAVYDQANREHQSNQQLRAEKILSTHTLEKSEETLAVALAGLRRAESALNESRSQVVVAQKTLDYHRAKLSDTVIKAPFSGLIVRRDREPGDVVVPGTSIFLLVANDTLWIRAWVDETRMKDLAVGQNAYAVFPAEPARRYPGRVARLGRDADRETREFVIDVAIDTLPSNWAVGQRVDVFVELARKENAVVVADRFLERTRGTPRVLVVRDGRAFWQPVRIGLQGRDAVEVIDLEPGSILIDPSSLPRRFREGGKVRLISQK